MGTAYELMAIFYRSEGRTDGVFAAGKEGNEFHGGVGIVGINFLDRLRSAFARTKPFPANL